MEATIDTTHPTPSGTGWHHEVSAPPDEVRRRLDAGLVSVGHLWFTSLAELRRWDSATSTLYIRWLGPQRCEVGPRLTNIQAARFSPVLRITLTPTPAGTRLEGRLATPRFALGLLGVWAAVLLAWLVLGLRASLVDGADPGWLVFWTVLALALALAAGMGRRLGGAALEDALPALDAVLGDPTVGDDDWA